jgi:hypothetical protein
MKYQVVEKVDGISDEFTVVAKFDTESAAQEFAMVHYETRIGILSECACLNCVDGFIVDVDWWKSFQVSVIPEIDGVELGDGCYGCRNSGRVVTVDEAQGHAFCSDCETKILGTKGVK